MALTFEKLSVDERLSKVDAAPDYTVDRTILADFAAQAFVRLSFTFPESHLEHLVSAACAADSSKNDRLVACTLLENAVIAAKGSLPLCQDTGVAQLIAWKDSALHTISKGYEPLFASDTEALSFGIGQAYQKHNLRFSINTPLSLFEERNSKTNLPACIDIFSTECPPDKKPSYRFLCCAKGGGSSNKTDFTCATKALLNEKAFEQFLKTKIAALGTAACPPYTIAVVIGGLSPEQNLLTLKLATTGYWEAITHLKQKSAQSICWTDTVGGVKPLRCTEWEPRILELARGTGLGAQFGGTQLAVHAEVYRLPRHGASCFASIGVSCNAHRNVLGYISHEGAFLQQTVAAPSPFLAKSRQTHPAKEAEQPNLRTQDEKPVPITLTSVQEVRTKLSRYTVGQAFTFSGKILVARDAAHARWKALLEQGTPLPDYTTQYPILYAGPAQTPAGAVIGSFGPTTANRMDPYAEDLMSRGAALITIAKGNRSALWTAACKKYGGFYFGTVGGAAALIAEKNITTHRVLDYPDLGMEAVQLITVRDLPVFLLIDDTGNDFYSSLS
ncbi:MAG: FumA C-terminus/TtdB family hydratase beta subunit [Treponema sp.]